LLLLLPPSETKRDGGQDGTALSLRTLAFPDLLPPRRTTLAALRRLSRNVGASLTALKLGPTQRFEVDRNRAVGTSPLLPAMDRYTGVLYDALDAGSLTDAARAFAGEHVAIHSALFGLVSAADGIPAYRVSHDSRLPDLSLRRHWAKPVSAVLAARDDMIIDLRSESYVHLGPAPESAWYVRVVSADGGQALNHFNKHGKGVFTRAVIESGVDHDSVWSLVDWAVGAGFDLRRGERTLELAVHGQGVA
jgi:cytoplasmic iron level regulating protein YaaA (DUF328/UPF0246 family)